MHQTEQPLPVKGAALTAPGSLRHSGCLLPGRAAAEDGWLSTVKDGRMEGCLFRGDDAFLTHSLFSATV